MKKSVIKVSMFKLAIEECLKFTSQLIEADVSLLCASKPFSLL